MLTDVAYQEVMNRKNEIMQRSLKIDYDQFKQGQIGFDYEKMMTQLGYSLEDVARIQKENQVGNTPLLELKNLTQLVRRISPKGKGATILMKDEAANPSGSFKDRRATLAVHEAKKKGFSGVIAATSGNYGAAVASQAAKQGLKCIVLQETYDSQGLGQPEILEKGRKCEALGAEVIQLTVGPELFYMALLLLDQTQYFNASLYSPYGIAGIETLGYEIGQQVKEQFGKEPAAVCVTHAGGGNVTGTARGLKKFGNNQTEIIGVSVDLSGLHMASDRDFNRKSFTTGHTGFSFPFSIDPDRSDVPRNAARPLRYLDRFVTVTQGEVFYVTELLAKLEGLERGPAGNTSLAAALVLAQQYDEDEIIVVQESEYTGAGKHPIAQLNFAKKQGVKIMSGNQKENIPGSVIAIPEHIEQLDVKNADLDRIRTSYLRNVLKDVDSQRLTDLDKAFLAQEVNKELDYIEDYLKSVNNC
ncbi:2-amino-4-oxopentanoate thiolase subunit OrtB [Neobacillus niacini]|uniref:2-amino-4-oxopentanoate thiolase subunit OrtB n=1 Tax=Neobacillus niacini TaxID=86668 RepID=UPI0021CB4531|nr:2-amino-4-oxopentanoate thiolase subunit OrtB [Neobacillus niacini]MCM3766034.1 2-amino-4-oxopentanoate thiolase subunit OrtB [Neobacillus niacini]